MRAHSASDEARLVRLEDLAMEIESLDKASAKVLVQRRKLQARLKSLVRRQSRIPAAELEKIEKELEVARENAMNLELWFSEYKQIAGVVVEEARDLLVEMVETRQQVEEVDAERRSALGMIDSLERARRALAEQIAQQAEEVKSLREAAADSGSRVAALESDLAAERAVAASKRAAGPSADLQARVAELEARYQEACQSRERERRSHAVEVGNLTKQLTQLRHAYEGQIAEMRERAAAAPPPAPSAPPITQVAPPARPASLVESILDAETGPRQGLRLLDPHTREEADPSKRVAAASPAASRAPAPTQLLLLDDEMTAPETVAKMAEGGIPVTGFSPSVDVLAQLPMEKVAAVALNLAEPGSWAVVRRLRSEADGRMVPMIAYAMADRASTGFWFGPIECALLPPDKDRLFATLQRIAPRMKQTIVIGHDDDASDNITRELRKVRIEGVSARNRAEALEAIKTVYPHIALLHPGSNPVDGFRALAALRGVSLFQRIPIVMLLEEKPVPKEEALYSGGVRTILRLGGLKAPDLAETISNAFTRYVRRPS